MVSTLPGSLISISSQCLHYNLAHPPKMVSGLPFIYTHAWPHRQCHWYFGIANHYLTHQLLSTFFYYQLLPDNLHIHGPPTPMWLGPIVPTLVLVTWFFSFLSGNPSNGSVLVLILSSKQGQPQRTYLLTSSLLSQPDTILPASIPDPEDSTQESWMKIHLISNQWETSSPQRPLMEKSKDSKPKILITEIQTSKFQEEIRWIWN